jgi:hypothetical protein
MRRLRTKFLDAHGEVRCTLLARITAERLGHPEWLLDDKHFVWSLALRVHDEHNAMWGRTG